LAQAVFPEALLNSEECPAGFKHEP